MSDSEIQDLPEDTGIYDLALTTGEGNRLRFTLKVPADPAGAPLILVLHYGGPPSGHYGRPLIEQLFGPALAPLNAMFIAPVSLGGDWTQSGNEQAVMDLFASIEKHYATDPTRRVISGYSMGGVGTWHFIERQPGYFSAAVAVSGYSVPGNGKCDTPIFAIHSTTDSIFDATALRDTADAMQAQDCNIRVEFLEGIDHFNVPAFASKLNEAVSWLEAIWDE